MRARATTSTAWRESWSRSTTRRPMNSTPPLADAEAYFCGLGYLFPLLSDTSLPVSLHFGICSSPRPGTVNSHRTLRGSRPGIDSDEGPVHRCYVVPRKSPHTHPAGAV